LSNTVPGRRRCHRSKTPIASPIPPPSAAGLGAWTPHNRSLLSSPNALPPRSRASTP
jgi:hypothetical protein